MVSHAMRPPSLQQAVNPTCSTTGVLVVVFGWRALTLPISLLQKHRDSWRGEGGRNCHKAGVSLSDSGWGASVHGEGGNMHIFFQYIKKDVCTLQYLNTFSGLGEFF